MDSESILNIIRANKSDASFEVTCKTEKRGGVKFEAGEFDSIWDKSSSIAGVRCIYKGKMGIAVSSLENSEKLKELLDTAFRLAKISGANDCQTYFSKTAIKAVHKAPDKLKNLDAGYVIKEINEANKEVSKIKNVYSVNCVVTYSEDNTSIANSNGIAGEYSDKITHIISGVTAKSSSDQASGENVKESRDYKHLNVIDNTKQAARKAVSMLGSKIAPTHTGSVILGQDAAISIIGFFLDALNGEEVLKRRSFLTEKLGQQVGSELLSLTENPNIPKSLHNHPFDDELVPTTKKVLVENGILKTYLHDIYSAEKTGTNSTGNAFRNENGIIDTTNVMLRPGKKNQEELIRGVKEGILLLDTGDSPNMTTGDLSAMVSNGFYIKNGKILYPVKETLIGINMVDLMRNIVDIGKDVISLDGINCPSLLVENVKISGK